MNIKKFNIDKIKEECKDIDPDIDYSKDDWKNEFIEKISWDYISYNEILSEDFMEYFKNYLNWDHISWRQDLSKSFMEKNKDKIDFHNLFHNDNISNEFILNNINWFINEDIKDSLRFKNKKFKDKWNKYKKLFGS